MPVPPVYAYTRQTIEEADLAAIREGLKGDLITLGPLVGKFERAIAHVTGAKHCIALANGTAALHAALLAMGLGPGDIGWTTDMTFVADANAIRYTGAAVDLVDIDPETWNISIPALSEKLVQAERAGKLPKVVIPVHFSGLPCDMPALAALAKRYDFAILEDGCHALGGRAPDGPVGNCAHSSAVAFSLHPAKTITTGEGGLVTTNDDALAERLRLLRGHGIARITPDEPWRAEMVTEGFNMRLTEPQAALGLAQLERMEAFVTRRAEINAIYRRDLAGLPIAFQTLAADSHSAHHMCVGRFDFAAMNTTKAAFYARMGAAGINLSIHYLPVHLHAFYKTLGYGKHAFPEAERYYSESFSLPCYPALTDADMATICGCIRTAIKA
jgi:UDP-4-amino-4,6-dideoxy-N-acetyl-beta-L-altrosamine transaminase